ncbi:MAG: serine hydrolase domain-containing protein [Gemmatimonadota bacterium]
MKSYHHPIVLTTLLAGIATLFPSPVVGQSRAELTPARLALLKSTLDSMVSARAPADSFSGVVLVSKAGSVVYSRAVGLSNKERAIPNTLDTRFNLGSANKMFTAVAIGQLLEQGKLRLTDTVGRLIPDFANRAVATRVTVQDLLTHRSGLGSFFANPDFRRRRDQLATIDDYVSLFAADTLAFTPGTRFRYSNSGFVVLGKIVERLSGENYFDYIRRHVLAPAGMRHTDFDDRHRDGDFAIGYTSLSADGSAAPSSRHRNDDAGELRGSPAGGAYSSAPDLVLFARALWSGKLLKPETVALFTTGKVAMGPQIKYAFGFGEMIVNGIRDVGHNGGLPGGNAEFASYPDLDCVVVVLSNYDAPSGATPVIMKIRDLIFFPDGGAPRIEMATGPAPLATQGAAQPLDRLDTPAARTARAYIEAFNSKDLESMRRFIVERSLPNPTRTVEERLDRYRQMRADLGTLTAVSATAASPGQLIVAVKAGSGDEVSLTFDVETDAPNRLKSLRVEAR